MDYAPYHPEFMSTKEGSESQENTIKIYAGISCAQRFLRYHEAVHFKYTTLTELSNAVNNLVLCGDSGNELQRAFSMAPKNEEGKFIIETEEFDTLTRLISSQLRGIDLVFY